jgi:hypothetical protein
MKPFLLPETDDTPQITLDPETGVFELSGKSLPEDVIEFYSPVFKWLDQYVANPKDITVFKVKVVYINSASQRAINEIFTILSRVMIKGKELEVEWHYHEDDYEMKEAGEEYADITKIPFVFKSYVPE